MSQPTAEVERPAMRGASALRIGVWGGVAAGAFLRIRAFSAGRSLWIDELLLALNLRDRTALSLLLEPMQFKQSAPPGYLLLGRSSAALLGAGDAALRSVSLLAGIGTVLLAATIAQWSIRNHALAVALVWSVALSPTLIYYSSELKQYSSDAFAMMLLLLLWLGRHELSWTAQAIGGALVALLSLPGLIAVTAVAAALVLEAAWSERRPERNWLGALAAVPTAIVRLRGLLLTWGGAMALHLLHGLTVGGDRVHMLDWWTIKGGFLPPPPWGRDDLSWLVTSLSRVVWLSSGHEGRAYPGMDRGPVQLMLGVAFLMLLGLAAGRRRRGWGLIPVVLLVGVATFVAASFKLYPFSSRLLVFFVPAVLVAVFVAADSVVHDRLASLLVLGVTVPLIAAQAAVTGPRAVAPLDDRDVREALELIGAGPPGAHIVSYEPLLLDWYRAELPATVESVIDDPSQLRQALLEVREGRIDVLWVVSTQRFEEAEADVAGLGSTRFVCVRNSRETFVAVALPPDSAESVACE